MHLLQSQGHLQGHSSVQRQEQQHGFIYLSFGTLSTRFFFNVSWFFAEKHPFVYLSRFNRLVYGIWKYQKQIIFFLIILFEFKLDDSSLHNRN